jgi:hypothetical protein
VLHPTLRIRVVYKLGGTTEPGVFNRDDHGESWLFG